MAILNAVLVLGAIGAVCALLLIAAAKFMAVPVDKKFPKIRECLPGANCGACGYAGCDGYAAALASGEETKTNKCIPGADASAKAIADVLGTEFEDVIEQVAVVKCSGDCLATKLKMDYQGVASCAAAKLVFGGRGSCIYGCIGFGDCAAVCPEGAITIVDGLARVDTRKCIGCGLCQKTCPNSVIMLMADVNKILVACSNREMGANTRKECSNGCIGCRMCERGCPEKAITVKNNLAEIDYDKCVACGHCAEVCTTGCISVMDFSGAHR